MDLLLPDVNGIVRGKRIDAVGIDKLYSEGICLPASLFGADVSGDTAEETGLGFEIGDMDYSCYPIPGTLGVCPGSDGDGLQVMLEMHDPEGQPFAINPRNILARSQKAMNAAGIFPVVAVELEFYLLDPILTAKGMPRLPINKMTGEPEQNTQVYLMQDLDDFKPFVDSVSRYARAQNIPASAAVSEYAPGQFEINLMHRDDPVAACDDAIALKRIIKAAAREHGYLASFMAKPFIDQVGSGTHIHTSLYDAGKNNLFAADKTRLHAAIGGLQEHMKDSMLLWAPHANSYRRFQVDSYVPLNGCWGYNNRTVALRIPNSSPQALRIEHRLAGADANPYLICAAVLAAMLEGMENNTACSEPINGNAYEQTEPDNPTEWLVAIDRFARSSWVTAQLGEHFQQVMVALKRAEYQRYQRQITPLEVSWCLVNV